MSSKATSGHRNADSGITKAKPKKHSITPLMKTSREMIKTTSKSKVDAIIPATKKKSIPVLQDIFNPLGAASGANKISRESSEKPTVTKKHKSKRKPKQSEDTQKPRIQTGIKTSPVKLKKIGPALKQVIESGSSNNDSTSLPTVKKKRPRKTRKPSDLMVLGQETPPSPEPSILRRPAHVPAVKAKIIHRKPVELARNKPRLISGMMTSTNPAADGTSQPAEALDKYKSLTEALTQLPKTTPTVMNVKNDVPSASLTSQGPIRILANNSMPIGSKRVTNLKTKSEQAKSSNVNKKHHSSPVEMISFHQELKSTSTLAEQNTDSIPQKDTSFKSIIQSIGAMSSINAEPVEEVVRNEVVRPVVPLHKNVMKVRPKNAVPLSKEKATVDVDIPVHRNSSPVSSSISLPKGQRRFPRVSAGPSSQFLPIKEVPNS